MTAQPDLIARGLGATDAQLFGPSRARYRVYVRDYRYMRVAELTDWTSFSFVRRFNGVGAWTLETAADNREARLLLKNGGIIVTRTVNGTQTTIFSGFVKTEWAWTARGFRAAGLSDDAHLQDVLARPVPSQDTGPYAVDAYVYGPATASTAMRQLVNVMCGPAAPGLWNNASIVLGADPLAGQPATIRGNHQTVLTILRELAADPVSGGLGFSLMQSDAQAGKLVFRVFVPQDRSAQAKFSVALNTISEYEDTWSAPDANYFVVMLGDGYGANRTLIEGQDTESVLETGRRTARTIDLRGSTDTGEGQQKLAEALAAARSSRRSAITPFDAPSLQFGEQYDFGDLVTVITQGGSHVDLIRAVEFQYDPRRGPVIIPMIGEGAGDDETERTARYLATVQDRLSNIERNWTTPPDSIDRTMLTPVLRQPIGEVKYLAGPTVPAGYLHANGQAVSRTTYALLFAEIGTTWGAGNGTTTFNVPDLTGRFPLGAGGSYTLGATGGAVQHSHAHSHGGGNLAYSHTHPGGSHSHDHDHPLSDHVHDYDINHDHPSVLSSTESEDAIAINNGASITVKVAGAPGHDHDVDLPNYTAAKTTDGADKSGGGQFLSTDSSDNVVPTNPYTTGGVSVGASWTGGTDPDNATGGSLPPYAVLTPVIYAGV